MTEKIKKLLDGVTVPRLPFHLELDGNGRRGSLFLSGINGIRDLTDTEALFRVRGFSVRIYGSRLLLTVYENRAVRLDGRIDGVELIYDKT
ncbi:MAG: hypothetical protein IJD51_02725 [Clostridia bacterium]|nr:hypothetical protein [Clostridia bacterium]